MNKLCIKKTHFYLLAIILLIFVFLVFTTNLTNNKSSINSRASGLSSPNLIISGYQAKPHKWPFYAILFDEKPKCKIVNGQTLCSRNEPTKPELVTNSGSVYKVGLRDRKKFCGATVISPEWAITAAHCVVDSQEELRYGLDHGSDYSSMRIAIGFDDLDIKTIDNRERYVYQIEKVIPHEGFSDTKKSYFEQKTYDIALIKFNTSIYSPSKLPTNYLTMSYNDNIDLAIQDDKWTKGDLTILGFGVMGKRIGLTGYPQNWNDYTFPTKLLQIELPLMRTSHKDESGNYVVSKDLIYMSNADKGKGLGKGDSGGPIIMFDSGKWILVGVVNSGLGSGYDMTDVESSEGTNVALFSQWINEKTNVSPNSGLYNGSNPSITPIQIIRGKPRGAYVINKKRHCSNPHCK